MTENERLTINGKEVILYREVETNLYRFSKDVVDLLLKAFEEVEQYRAIGTVEEIQKKMEELDRWHTDKINENIKNPFAYTSTSICHNCDHKDEYIEELETEVTEYKSIGTIEEFKALKNKHIGKDNMVISSSDLMTILNSDSEELKEVRKGFEENRKAGYKHGYADGYAKGIDDLVNGLLNWKSQDEEYKSFSDVCNEIAEQLKGGVE